MGIATTLLHGFWKLASTIGTRRLGSLLRRGYSSAYGDTLFCWEAGPSGIDPPGRGLVALTIDDGLCRGDDSKASMVSLVQELLKEYGATATFFVCSDYCGGADREDEIPSLLAEGHELGNHLQEDRSGYYCYLNETDFAKALEETNRMLEEYVDAHNDGRDGSRIRWFRPPQGRMSPAMKKVLQERGMTSVLGDTYCDDWAFAEKDGSTAGVVAPLMLSQVRPGSIAIFHMPQRGFRESTLDALREFLEGIQARNLRCTTLSEAACFYGG